MAARKHDRQALVVGFLEAKAQDHKLTLRRYCDERQLSYRYMSRIIGGKVVAAWDRIVSKTLKGVEEEIGVKLASTLSNMAQTDQALYAQGLAKVLKTDKNPNPEHAPSNHDEAMEQIKAGGTGFRATAALLLGDKPAAPLEAVEGVFRFNEPVTRRPRKVGSNKKARRRPSKDAANDGA